jgi:colicin import membrane protein
MAEQRENSVLFSLKELRRIEDDRIRQEEADVQARAEAERRSREDAERRAREEVERRRRDEEDRVRRIEEEKMAHEREGNMRLQEAERRARVEAETRLQEERMRLEIQHQKHKSPMPIVLAVAGVLVLVGGIIVYKVNVAAEERRVAELRAKEETAAAEAARIKREADEKLHQLEKLIAEKEKALATAKTDDERAQIRRDIERAREGRRASPPRSRQSAETPPPPPPRAGIREKKKISDDPLEGLKL